MSDARGRRPSDRGIWLVVARRDSWVRLRDKGFLISTAITLLVLSAFILIRAYGGSGTPSFDLGLLGSRSGPTGSLVVEVAKAQHVDVATHQVANEQAAEAGLRDGSLDAVLKDGDRLIAKQDVPAQLSDAVRAALLAERIQRSLLSRGVSAQEAAKILSPAPVPVRSLEPTDPNRQTNSAVAFVAVFLLYGQLFGYGVWVATGVIEEKSSRVVEILLSSIRARQLLAGKILGIGALGLLQLACISAFAITLASVTGALSIPAHALGTALLAIGWFALGFAFYASLFAVAGALVARMEELQNAIVPLNLLILASFFVSIGAVNDPGSPMARIASLIPFSAPLAMPVRISLGAASPIEIVASLAILIGSTALLIPLAGRVYTGAVLRTGGRVKIRDAWRSAD